MGLTLHNCITMHGAKKKIYSPCLRSRLTIHYYRCIWNAGISYSCTYLVNGEIDHDVMCARAHACCLYMSVRAHVSVTVGGSVVRISPVSKAKCASCSIVRLTFSSASALTKQRTQRIFFTQTNHSDILLSKCMGLRINCAVILSDFKQNNNIMTNFRESQIRNFTKNLSAGNCAVLYGLIERRPVTRRLIVAFRSCLAVAPKTNQMLHFVCRKNINHKWYHPVECNVEVLCVLFIDV